MTINLLPWREVRQSRRRLLLVVTLWVALLVMVTAAALGAVVVRCEVAIRQAAMEVLQHKNAVVGSFTQQLRPAQAGSGGLLNQLLDMEVSLSHVNDPLWLSWVSEGLIDRQLNLTTWLATADQLELRLDIHNQMKFSELTAWLESSAWQLVELNAREEAMNVVIEMPAMEEQQSDGEFRVE